ncbi:MAG: hypothetical protein GY797_30060 [Deltaproteobacteria bacterium]|nr:hypothetical protein [Deltaproteobacteria bacterium]
MEEEKYNKSLELLWDDFKFRQTHWWSIANRFALAIIAVLILPFAHPKILTELGRATIILPAFGFVFSLAATWILGAEYQRVKAVRSRFIELAPEDIKLKYPDSKWYERLFGQSIGYISAMIFLIGFTSLSVIDAIALWILSGR